MTIGIFDHIEVHESIPLPGYPDDRGEREFQTKSVDYPSMDNYRVTEEGRLEMRRRSYREKTDAEKREYAHEHGYGSWDGMVERYNEIRNSDEDTMGQMLDEGMPFAGPKHETIDEEWWVDQEYHGDVEIHRAGIQFEPEIDEFFSYTLRFTHGTLEEVTRNNDG